jgi:hypothetical protein
LPGSDDRWQHGFQICFATFTFVKNYKIAKIITATKARETISTALGYLEFLKYFDVGFG